MLLQRVEPLFDWIIMDSPPAIPVSDASVLAKACDGVVMVVRSECDAVRSCPQGPPGISRSGPGRSGAERDQEDAVPYSALLLRGVPEKGSTAKVLGRSQDLIRLFNVYYPVRTLVLLVVEALVVGSSFLLATWWLNQETSWID